MALTNGGMNFRQAFAAQPLFLMEGALAERLKHEFGLLQHEQIALAAHIYSEEGRRALRQLWQQYIAIAQRYALPFIATTPTRRANRERVAATPYSEVIADNLAFLGELLSDYPDLPAYRGGLVGCKGDAYLGTEPLDEEEARAFHAWSIQRFAAAGADFIYAGIMPTLPEIIGLVRAANDADIPCIISLMLRPDGRIIDGTELNRVVETVDEAVATAPLCYMTNCVHPANLYKALSQPFNRSETVRRRFLGIQANASPNSIEELEGSETVLSSQPQELAADMLRLRELMQVKIVGGCCGTTDRHMEEIAQAFLG